MDNDIEKVEPTRIERIKQHVKDHKIAYACGATAVVTGVVVAGITCVIMRESHAGLRGGPDWSEKTPVDSLSVLSNHSIFGKVSNSMVTTIHKGNTGNPGFVTRCVETGELFATQGDAARAFNIPEPLMSGHLNKGLKLVEDLNFERVGVLS